MLETARIKDLTRQAEMSLVSESEVVPWMVRPIARVRIGLQVSRIHARGSSNGELVWLYLC